MRALPYILLLVLGVLLAGVYGYAHADAAVYKNGDLSITLLSGACDVPPLSDALTAAESQIPPKRAIIRMGQKEVPACWGVFEQKVLIADVLGNAGFVLMKDFKDDPGV